VTQATHAAATPDTGRLLLSCPDRHGIVAAVSGFVADDGANIVTPGQLELAGQDVERIVLARAIQWHLADQVLVHENRTVVFA
jgi:formyltetrahydrofolate hydrolase